MAIRLNFVYARNSHELLGSGALSAVDGRPNDCRILKARRGGRYEKPGAGPGSQGRRGEDLSVILGNHLLSFARTTLNRLHLLGSSSFGSVYNQLPPEMVKR